MQICWLHFSSQTCSVDSLSVHIARKNYTNFISHKNYTNFFSRKNYTNFIFRKNYTNIISRDNYTNFIYCFQEAQGPP